jgi:transposase InsO family protein
MLNVSRQGFYDYLIAKNQPWKYQDIAEAMMDIRAEDVCNDTYGRTRMRIALRQRLPEGQRIPSEGTIQKIMVKTGLGHFKKRKPNGITKAERNARKSDNLIQRDFSADKPCQKCITDITEIKGRDGKLYVSGIFDCFDTAVLGLSIDTNMKTPLCVKTLANACLHHPELRNAIIHSDRGSQYTSKEYREAIKLYGIRQSMNSDGGRCHDNARCESIWARMKVELFYGRMRTEDYTVDELKQMVWRYFMSYWNNRRICTANGGLPPMVKRKEYYTSIEEAA